MINSIAPFLKPSQISDYFQGSYGSRPRSILTLDDGFIDNYDFAINVLDDLKIKAIFFVIPYFIDNNYTSAEYIEALFPNFNKFNCSPDPDQFLHLTSKQIQTLDNN